jgi:hypothetical protein
MAQAGLSTLERKNGIISLSASKGGKSQPPPQFSQQNGNLFEIL